MKLYRKGTAICEYKIDSTWEEIEDEMVETPIGIQLKSYTLTPEFVERLERQQKINRIAELKIQLANTDYQAIKHSEGLITEDEYTPIKAQRQSWRDEINSLEQSLN